MSHCQCLYAIVQIVAAAHRRSLSGGPRYEYPRCLMPPMSMRKSLEHQTSGHAKELDSVLALVELASVDVVVPDFVLDDIDPVLGHGADRERDLFGLIKYQPRGSVGIGLMVRTGSLSIWKPNASVLLTPRKLSAGPIWIVTLALPPSCSQKSYSTEGPSPAVKFCVVIGTSRAR